MIRNPDKNELIIVAGPNGSGKTTLAKEYLDAKKGNYAYLSADEIAYEINPENPISVRLEAGKEFYNRFDRLIADRKNVLIETTLSGKSVSNLIEQVREQGQYLITLIFIFLDSEALCIERVKTRVRKGGHPVPKECPKKTSISAFHLPQKCSCTLSTLRFFKASRALILTFS